MRIKDILYKIRTHDYCTNLRKIPCVRELQEQMFRKWECNASIMKGFNEEDCWLLYEEVEGIIISDTTLMIYINVEVSNV